MKKETQFLCIFAVCGFALILSGCGIRPAKLMSPTDAEQQKAEEAGQTDKGAPTKAPTFPATYPKAAR